MNKTSSQVQLSWDFEKSFEDSSLLGYGRACSLSSSLGAWEQWRLFFKWIPLCWISIYSFWGMGCFDVVSSGREPHWSLLFKKAILQIRGWVQQNPNPIHIFKRKRIKETWTRFWFCQLTMTLWTNPSCSTRHSRPLPHTHLHSSLISMTVTPGLSEPLVLVRPSDCCDQIL